MEGIIEYFRNGSGHLVRKDHQESDGGSHVNHSHGRHHFGSGLGNALEASQGNGRHQDGEHHCGVGHRDPGIQLGDLDDGVHLGEGPDAEVGHQHPKEGKGNGQRPVSLPQPVFNVVHGAAGNLSLVVHRTVFDGQAAFRIFGGHTEKGSDPHPQDGPRAPGFDGRSHPHDVPGAHRGCQGRAQGFEGINVPFPLVLGGKDQFQRPGQPEHLEKAQPEAEENPGPHQEDQQRRSPDKTVDLIQQGNTHNKQLPPFFIEPAGALPTSPDSPEKPYVFLYLKPAPAGDSGAACFCVPR